MNVILNRVKLQQDVPFLFAFMAFLSYSALVLFLALVLIILRLQLSDIADENFLLQY